MAFNFKAAVLKVGDELLAPIVRFVVDQVIKVLMIGLRKEDESLAEVVAVALYPIADVELEDAFEKTDTKVDDAIIDGVKSGLEKVAAEWQLELPNLDDD